MIESDADRLAMIQAVGETFDAGTSVPMWAVYDRAFEEAYLGEHSHGSRRPILQCLTSDVVSRDLVKGSPVTRLSDDVKYLIDTIEDDGTGITVLVLRK